MQLRDQAETQKAEQEARFIQSEQKAISHYRAAVEAEEAAAVLRQDSKAQAEARASLQRQVSHSEVEAERLKAALSEAERERGVIERERDEARSAAKTAAVQASELEQQVRRLEVRLWLHCGSTARAPP